MVIFEHSQYFLIPLCILFLSYLKIRTRKKSPAPTNWPLVGMLPGFLQNIHRIQDYITEILNHCGGTFVFKGPWFSKMNMIFTCDPANIHHIFSKNFSNYPKGPEFRKIFDILGDGILNADYELWEFNRKTTLLCMSNVKFRSFLERSIWEKVENGLFRVLDYYSKQGIAVDLQDIFQRFTFDNICKLVFNYDPGTLSVDLPCIPCEKAFNDVIEALLHRHFLPESVWKLQQWLKVGKEKKLFEARKALDEFIYPLLITNEGDQNDDFNLLATFRREFEEKNGSSAYSRHFLRDTSLSLMFAGRDTTSTTLTWFFWLIAKNHLAKTRICEEIEVILDKRWKFFNAEESRRLVYLHGALCESLRLFPPIALEHKAPMQSDTLPSGNNLVDRNMKVIISFYSTGRMEGVWGEDCLEFKQERWILAGGGVKQEPSYKFPAFNAGPRTCLGKEMAFIQMKMVAEAILCRYHIEVVEGHLVAPRNSMILQMKHGLRVKLCQKNV
ncbi:Cytochrome P450 CYP4/CYP19/CYP26 subfamily [Handroanthus impetiginosus]|uniref:Cytochrome P450 CYP4/CYP19/CYP26 subfamily n=1 Tax=Handroanthus impetiginosus TaxID=429701 RepID=A0A2G9GGV4_9LAMI|nr:Cytochrome P450 CYP4/CYP19/CYP26 subfamily [Handroanthus impetiginosus]